MKIFTIKQGILTTLIVVSLLLITILTVSAFSSTVTILFSCDTYGNILPCV
jgi:hypothetical protein